MSREAFEKAIAKISKELAINQLTYSDLIGKVKNHAKKLDASQHNCFTWARSKLLELKINVVDLDFESIISVTTLMAKYNPEDDVPPCDCLDKLMLSVNKEERIIVERFVTYNTNRDKRTYDWKIIERKATLNHVVAEVADITGMVRVALIVAAPLTIAAGPLALAVMATGGVCALTMKIARDAMIESHNILRAISEQKKFNQPGNSNSLSEISTRQVDENYVSKDPGDFINASDC